MSVATPPSTPSNNKATFASSKICDTGFSVNAKTLTKNCASSPSIVAVKVTTWSAIPNAGLVTEPSSAT